jgi:DNA adenine methylase
MPEKALLNDINPHTMNFYQWLKKGLRISLPLDNEGGAFYEYRRLSPAKTFCSGLKPV